MAQKPCFNLSTPPISTGVDGGNKCGNFTSKASFEGLSSSVLIGKPKISTKVYMVGPQPQQSLSQVHARISTLTSFLTYLCASDSERRRAKPSRLRLLRISGSFRTSLLAHIHPMLPPPLCHGPLTKHPAAPITVQAKGGIFQPLQRLRTRTRASASKWRSGASREARH